MSVSKKPVIKAGPVKSVTALNENEFPPLSATAPKKPVATVVNPPPAPSLTQPKPTVPPQELVNLWKEFEGFDIKSPESITQTELTPQDFGYALSSSLNLIPDAPFEVDPSIQDEKSGDDNFQQSYPRTPYLKLLQPEYFKKYDTLTLFYIFFHFPGTSQQYFAGRELKRRDWFFYKPFQTWFHKIGDSNDHNEHYDTRYEYFDHSTSESWTIRQRMIKIDQNQIEE